MHLQFILIIIVSASIGEPHSQMENKNVLEDFQLLLDELINALEELMKIMNKVSKDEVGIRNTTTATVTSTTNNEPLIETTTKLSIQITLQGMDDSETTANELFFKTDGTTLETDLYSEDTLVASTNTPRTSTMKDTSESIIDLGTTENMKQDEIYQSTNTGEELTTLVQPVEDTTTTLLPTTSTPRTSSMKDTSESVVDQGTTENIKQDEIYQSTNTGEELTTSVQPVEDTTTTMVPTTSTPRTSSMKDTSESVVDQGTTENIKQNEISQSTNTEEELTTSVQPVEDTTTSIILTNETNIINNSNGQSTHNRQKRDNHSTESMSEIIEKLKINLKEDRRSSKTNEELKVLVDQLKNKVKRYILDPSSIQELDVEELNLSDFEDIVQVAKLLRNQITDDDVEEDEEDKVLVLNSQILYLLGGFLIGMATLLLLLIVCLSIVNRKVKVLSHRLKKHQSSITDSSLQNQNSNQFGHHHWISRDEMDMESRNSEEVIFQPRIRHAGYSKDSDYYTRPLSDGWTNPLVDARAPCWTTASRDNLTKHEEVPYYDRHRRDLIDINHAANTFSPSNPNIPLEDYRPTPNKRLRRHDPVTLNPLEEKTRV